MNWSPVEQNQAERGKGTKGQGQDLTQSHPCVPVSIRTHLPFTFSGRRTAIIVALGLALVAGLLPPRPISAQVAGETASDNSSGQRRTVQTVDGRRTTPSGRVGIPTTPREMLEALRWYFVAPFVFASVLAVWFGIERLVVLRHGRVIPRPFVERFVQHLRQGKVTPAKALMLCQENGSPVATVFAHGVRKWGKPSVEVEQAIIDGGERQVSQLRKHLRVLNGVATITPLIGLLGTVIGMILAFNEIANSNAMGKAEELAGGIALALLTTAVGLMIAIPSLIMYTYLAGRVDALVMEMDDLAQQVVQLISAEGLSSRTVASQRVRSRKVASKPPAEPKEKKAV